MFRHKLIYLFLVFYGVLYSQENINQYNEQNQRHGLWKVNFEGSDQLKFQGTFKNGQEIGEFKFYKKGFDEHPSAIINFEEEGMAQATYYTQDGDPISRGKLKDKKREGEWIYFHRNAKDTMMIENYDGGMLEGVQKTFFPDGTLAEKTHWKNDLKHGESLVYSDSGTLLQRLEYKEGEFHGPVVYYNNSGEKLIEGEYQNDRKSGKWIYYKNGKPDEEKEY